MQILTAAQSVKIICTQAPTKEQALEQAVAKMDSMIEACKNIQWEKIDGKWVRL